MTRRTEITLALAITLWLFVLPTILWLAYAYWHGFDPGLCWSYGGCQELKT